MRKHILILGGTTEARELGEQMAGREGVDTVLSLAGRTASPLAQAVPVRSGGFGGVDGLAQYLREHEIDALIDATHPYAPTISAHAWGAASQTGTPMIALCRPPWMPVPGDRWIEAGDAGEAAAVLGGPPRNVFLAVGRQEISHFAAAPQHRYLIRSVDPVEPPLAVAHAHYILARGPFDEAQERELLAAHAIDVVVAKNSGGSATYGKIAAARALGLCVVLLRRPRPSAAPQAASVGEAAAWLDHVLKAPIERGV
jgi:precorrin-6A/cobalt-precorrin-6A reductase